MGLTKFIALLSILVVYVLLSSFGGFAWAALVLAEFALVALALTAFLSGLVFLRKRRHASR